MRKIFVLAAVFLVFTGSCFAQSAQQLRVAKIFEILSGNFEKYPFVIVTKPSKADPRGFTDDNSAERALINGMDPLNKDGTPKDNSALRRMDKNVAMDSNGRPVSGERITIDIVQAGYRYEAIMYFYPVLVYAQAGGDGGPQRRQGAETANAVKSRLYTNLFANILPPQNEKEEVTVPAPSAGASAPAPAAGTTP